MKIFLTLLFLIFISTFSYTQDDLKREIENLPIEQHNGCDTIQNKRITNIIPCELSMYIEIDSVIENNQTLNIIGKVKTQYLDEPIPYCSVRMAIFETNYCNFLGVLDVTDIDGNFNVVFENNKKLSLYFSSLGFIGYEIKIGKLL